MVSGMIGFYSYLNSCKQSCKVNGGSSEIKSIEIGQGSCLGPLLFPFVLPEAHDTMYADDTTISYSPEIEITRLHWYAWINDSRRFHCLNPQNLETLVPKANPVFLSSFVHSSRCSKQVFQTT